MKVSEIPYRRYTVEEAREVFDKAILLVENAKSVQDLLSAHKLVQDANVELTTWASLANCRFTLNTKDEFYQKEMDFYDENMALFSQMSTRYDKAILQSPYLAELKKHLNPRIIRQMELSQKCFADCIIADLQEENKTVTEYSKFMSEMVFTYEGEEMPLSKLRGKLEDGDREVRKNACHAIGSGLGIHRKELDDIFDRLVKIRTRIAKKLGYDNFVELGYYRMGRLDYDAPMVEKFRSNVKADLVPAVSRLKQEIAKNLGIDRMKFYDNDIVFRGEAPHPVLNTEEIFAEAQKMYDGMSPEIGAFMREMREAEAFDVESRDGKWGGGYCTAFPKFRQPFILANFNGSCGDIDVITHEFGHALAEKFTYDIHNVDLGVGGMETAECHSMSMEFFCWKGIDRFFGNMGNAYRKKHLLDALSFIPYGVIVDEFQHEVYAHPEYTPKQRNDLYLSLEKKYRPYLDFAGIPYLEEGTRWQYQMHIYESPFYYIDYCLAQTVALGFLLASQKDYDKALQNYLVFARQGGTKAFESLIEEAGLQSPFQDGALKEVSQEAIALAEKL